MMVQHPIKTLCSHYNSTSSILLTWDMKIRKPVLLMWCMCACAHKYFHRKILEGKLWKHWLWLVFLIGGIVSDFLSLCPPNFLQWTREKCNFFLFKFFRLDYSCFPMLFWLLLQSGMNQPCVHICPLPPELPLAPPHPQVGSERSRGPPPHVVQRLRTSCLFHAW